MAIIYTYPVKTTPANDDLILISDSADGNKTKQVKMSSLPGAQGSGITSLGTSTSQATGSSQTFAIGDDSPITIVTSPNANRHTFGWTGQLSIAKGGTGISSSGSKNKVLTSTGTAFSMENPKTTITAKLVSGSLVKGQPVFIVGSSSGSIPRVAASDGSTNNTPIIGLAAENVTGTESGAEFEVITKGILSNINTSSIPTASAGDPIYVDTASGSSIANLTGVKPAGTKVIQTIGVLIDQNASSGSILVSVDGEIEGLPNFNSVNPGTIRYSNSNQKADELELGNAGQVLVVNSGGTAPEWAAAPPTGVTTINFSTTGLTPNSATSGAVTVAGTLVAANGGTGNTNYTVGDLLYATGSTTLSKLSIPSVNPAGKVLTVNSGGTNIEWADNAVQASGANGRVQLSDGSGNFTNDAGLNFSTQTLIVGDTVGQGKVTIKGNQSGSPSQLILHSSYTSATPPVSQGSYTIQPPGSTFGPTNFTWTLPNGSPSAAGSILTTSTTGTSATLAWASKVPVANGGTGLTAAGTQGHVLKSTGSALAMQNRDGGFLAVTALNGVPVSWNYNSSPNLAVTLPFGVGAQTMAISNVVDGDEGVLIIITGGGGINLPSNSIFPGGTAYVVSAAGKKDLLRFKYYNSEFYWTFNKDMS